MKILSLVGARPQFVKEAVLSAAVQKANAWQHILVHSGQHYDSNMSDIFFQELGIPKPAYHLGIGSGSHASMTAAALTAMEEVLLKEKPDALLVYGDTNTTLAGALAAAKLHVPVIHIEAGIRMLPKNMPEEINRTLTDRLSSIMCCCSELGKINLQAEGITKNVVVTGDVMYDLYLHMQPQFTPEKVCTKLNVEPEKFVIATLHRDYNVDSYTSLHGILSGLCYIQQNLGLQVVLPIHPRTAKRIKEFGLSELSSALTLCEPVGYLDLMSFVSAAAFVVTDSGGLQKEAFYAEKRAAVMMPDTGWRELTDNGWNTLCAPEQNSIIAAANRLLDPMPCPCGIYGNGNASKLCIEAILNAPWL